MEKKYLNFGCVLQGDIKCLKKIRERIVQEYVALGLVKLSKPRYDKNEIYIVTADQWEEYQRLKKCKEDGLIGAWF
ncbi:MAG: hypothetical protein PVF58_11015 [Candidatus Methanofastidiosia archaeon]|jgi:hypothetical protein